MPSNDPRPSGQPQDLAARVLELEEVAILQTDLILHLDVMVKELEKKISNPALVFGPPKD